MKKLYTKPTVMLGLFWAFMLGFIFNAQATELNRPNAISVIAFSPTNGVVGNTITVVGSDLSGVTVTFAGGVVAPTLTNNGFALTVQVPAGATSGPLTVSRGAESITTTTSFTLLSVPSYCSPSHTAGCVGNGVGTVRILTTPVNFTNSCASTNGPSYTVLSPSSNTTTTLTAGQSYTFEITPNGTVNSAIGFWGDWNANGTFETTEYTSFGTGNPSGTLVSRSITLPTTVTAGLTAVRVRTSSGTVNNGSACTAFTSGETVDFFVTLQASAPAPSITSFTPSGARVGDIITVNGTNLTGATFRFNGTLATTNSNTGTQAQIVVPTGAATGRISVTTPGGTTVSNFDFTVFGALDFVMSATPITTCEGIYYSPNSPGNYPNNTNITQVITPATAGNQVRLDFTRFALSAFGGPNPDRLQIFNGPNASSPALHSGNGFVGSLSPFSVQASNPTGQLTLVFITDNNNNAAGFQADLSCVAVTGPGISGFSPATGAVGTTVTISGFNFNVSPGLQVRFNGTLATVTANTDNSITVTVPTGATTGPITVTNGAGTATSTAGFVVPGGTPTITSFTPNNGSIGSTVTITGTNLLPLTQARFTAAFGPGANATVVSNNGISLVLIVPNNAATGPITVQTSAGTVTSTASYTVNGTPTITTFTASGAVGSQITIQGANFAPGGVEPTILINGITATVVNFGPNFAQVTVPTGATTGPITITTSAGSFITTTNFVVLQNPVIANFTPFSGAVGTQVTITGSNLTGGTFLFNGTAATTLSNDGSTAVVTVPTGATTGFITVTSPNGSGTSNPRQFQVLVPPTITSFTPTSGPVGTVINITGTGFNGATTFQVNGVTAGGGALTTTTARITVSAGTTSGPIRVTNANGSSVSATDFTVTGLAPTITSFTPASGPVGTTVTVNGTNFISGTQVIYGGNPVATTILTQSQLTFVIPTGATSGLIIVSNANGNALSTGNFTVTGGLTPTITSFTPASGSVGEVISINGTNFNLANTEVRFNGVLVTTLVVNSTNNIQVVIPSGATTGPITVTTPAGTGTSGTNFTVVVPPPVLNFFTPDQGGVGGTTTLFGSGFSGATSVTFNGTNSLFVVIDDNTITATVPAGATSGLIRVTTPGGVATSFGPFTITTLPVISTVNPVNGIIGSTVTITGSNLSGATSVTLNGTSVPVISNTATQIQVRIPAGATSGFFSVTTPAGVANDFINFFTVEVPPTITAVRPLSGNVGDIVEIDGDGLTTSNIQFNGTLAGIVGITATGIQVQVPTGATTGFITATSTVGSATSASVFTVTNLRPNIVSISPTTGAEGTAVTISGFNLGGVTSVRFGTLDATFFPLNSNTLQAFAPAGLTGSNFIFVDGASGRDTSLQQFTVLATSFCGVPTIARPRLFPTTTTNSTLVTAGSAYSFKFFGSRDSVYIFSTCNSPSGEDSFLRIYNRQGTAIISQSDDGGSYCSGLSASIEFTPAASDTFIVHLSRFNCASLQTDQLLTYFRRAVTTVPVILNFEPASALVGTQIEVSGANFTGVTAVRVNGVNATFTPQGPTRLFFTIPAGATTGPITVTTAAGTGTSSTNLTVLTATAPLINFIAPTTGTEGTVITINGTNLGPNPIVTINGVTVTGLTVDPTFTNITATVAPGTTTGVVRVTTPSGSFTTTDPFIITRTAPVITAVTPNSGAIGTTVTISGSSLLNPTSVSFNGTPAIVTASTNNSITVTVPTGATSGLIAVANEVGVGFSPSVFNVVLPLPTITNFSPTSAARGVEVTINGTNLLGSSVFFGTAAATITSNTATQIRAVVPATAVTAPITVATIAGTVVSTNNFTVILPPVIASFTPLEGVPGDTITVTGSDLSSVTNVAIGTTFATNIVSNTATSLRFIVPVGSSTAQIRVTTGFGATSSVDPFTVIQAPQITSFTPSSGSVGANVTITGLNLLNAIVRFNGVLVTSLTTSNNSISAQVPSGATTGFITVTNRAGSVSATTPFIVNGAGPIITSFDPAQAAVGSNVLVSGANFTGATNVLVGGTRIAATFSVISDNQIRFTIPTGTTDGPIIVFTPNGSDTSNTSFRISTTLFGAACTTTPFVNGGRISPVADERAVLAETGFGYYYKFFASQDSVYTFSTCRSGSGAGNNDPFLRIYNTRNVNTIITENDDNGVVCTGQFASLAFQPTASDTFFVVLSQFPCRVLSNTTILDYSSRPVNPAPFIYLGTPQAGSVGSTVVLTGANLRGVGGTETPTITINGVPQTFVATSTNARVSFTVATGTTNGRIVIRTTQGSDSTNFIFIVNLPGGPTITGFTPFTGTGNTPVRINGTNLASPTSVTVNGLAAQVVASTATNIDILIPNGAGTGPITVTTATGTITSTGSFIYIYGIPTITSFTPTSGTVGTSVRVRGTNLGGLTAVTFNGIAATSITNRTDTAFTVAVPVSATTGAISVVTPGGTALSGAPFTVIVNTPTITSFTPSNGVVGSQVTITGTNLTGATVFFGGIQATNIISNSATSIVAVVPVNAQTGPITVTTSSGFVVSSTDYVVRVASITFNTPTGIPTRICAGSTATVAVTVTGNPQGTNVFTVEGSNGSGSFATPFIIGSLTSSASGAISIPVTIPSTVRGTGFRYRVVSTAPAVISGDNGTNIQIDTVPNTPVVTASGSTDLCPGGTVTLTAPNASGFLWSTGATTRAITVSTAGTYTVRLINGLCTSGTSVPVIINTFPNPGQPTITASGPLTFCSGGSVTLSGPAGANGYLWSNGATTQTINVTASGSFTLRVSNANGCQSPVSAATTVTVTGAPAAPAITAGGSTVLCNGQTVQLNGPAGATSYLWSNGGTTRNITVSAAGNYSLIVTNAGGCPSPSSNIISVSAGTTPATPTITAGGATTFCTGGSVTLTAPAGATGYLWSNGATTQSINVTTSGNFTVQVSNAAGCFSLASAATSVTVNTLPTTPTITASGPTTFCSGGSVTLTAPTATSYIWSNGATTQSINVTTSGTFTVAVTNAAGCTSAVSASRAVVVNATPTQPTVTASGATTFCAGGSVTLTATGGTNYIWSNGATTSSITVNNSGNFTVQAVNTGCTSLASAPIAVTVNPVPTTPTITASGATTFCTGGSVTLTAPVSAGYIWNTGETTRSITVNTTGNVTVRTINASGCTSAVSAPTAVTVNFTPAQPTVTIGGATTFCEGGSVTLTAPAGFPTYVWSNGATTRAITVTTSGNYSVSVATALGCTSVASAAVPVTVNTLPTTPTITASGPTTFCSGGSVTLSAPTATSYIWSNGATTQSINVTASGTFTVAVTNAAGCTSAVSASRAVVVNPTPAQPTVTVGGPTTFCNGGSVTLTAPAGFSSYVWSNGATTRAITATVSGNYSVSVGTAAGCTSVASNAVAVTVNPVPAQPTITASGATTFCAGGTVTLTASAANSYIWSNGATTQSIVVSTSGNFTVAAINASGCTSAVSAATSVVVNPIPALPTITASGATTFCNGGSVSLTAPAASAYIWSNGETTRSIVATTSGNYSVSIVSAAGCTSAVSAATSVTVNPIPAQPSVSAGGATTFCTGGSVTLTATGGTNYIWSNGATTPSITVNAAGSYTARVISAGCTSVASAPISVVVNALPTRPTITAGGATNFCDGGSVTLTAPAATSYIWSNGATTQSINVTASGSFTVAVTNAAGCTSAVSAATVVTVNPIPTTPTISASGSTTLCAGGSVTLTASTGASYIWSNGATTSSINVNAAGNYTVRVISASGCTSAASVATAVIVNPIPATPVITASGATTFCAGGSVTLETADVAGASYLWSNGSITRSIVATAAGSYSVQVISAEGCTSLASTATPVTITAQPAAATISASGSTTLCAGDSVTLTGPVTSSSYSWSNGATTQSIRVSAAGTYTLTLFNGSCAGTPASQDVIVNPRPATPVITASGPTVFCSGGDVTLTATENTDGYLWSNGATTRSITVSASADLSVVLLGANGCTSLPSAITQVRAIALPTTPTISARTATTFCEGNGVWLVGPAGLGAYSWSNGATTDSIFVTTSGTYTLQAGGGTCISAASNAIAVTVNPIPATPTISAGSATTFCAGGSVTLSAPAGAAGYLWSNGATTETITVSAAGSYTAQVIGANGCPSAASNSIAVIVTPVTTTPVISAASATSFCEGGSVVISAAQPAGSYLWSTGETTSSITVSSTANISLVTIDADACTSAVSNTIAVAVNSIPTALNVTASGATTICDGSSVVLTATAGADSYLWSNGETTQSINASAAGNYSVVSISAAGCTSLGSNVVPVNVQPITPQPTITAGGPTTLCAGETVTLTASAADEYLWSTGETTQSITVSSTASVSVVTTNAGSCESVPSATVEVNISAVPNAPVIAFTGSTGICVGETVTLVAPAGFANYLWSDGSTNDTLIAASAGDYTVQVGNNAVCLSPASAAVTITADPITPTPTITVDGDLAFCTGDSVVLTASSVADAYLWSTGATTRSITVFNAGSYSLSTTLAGACPSASSASVDVVVNALPSTPVVTAIGGTNLCAGGTVTLQAPAGFAAYLWSDGSTTESIQVSSTGDYSVVVANASGCISEESNAITVGLGSPSATPTFTASGPLTFCEGTNVILTADATADAYLWSNGATTRSITVTTAGTFSLQVQNAGSCISEASSAVTTIVTPALAAPTITATGATTVCAGETVTLTAPAGFDSYLWSNGNNTQSITVNASGNYSVVVQNTGTCASLPSNEIAVLVNPISATPTVTASGVTTFCQGGSVTLTASASTGSYLWSNGATTRSITVNASGTFTVQVTDAASCISVASAPTTVVVNPIPTTPTITLTGNAGLCGTETAQLSAPAGAAAYIWSNGATTQNITVSTAATYTVRVVNVEGCTSAVSAGQTITVLPVTTTPVITAGGPTSFCVGGNVTLTAPLAASYLWSTGETTRNITVNTAGNYTVQTTAAGSCISAPSVATSVVVNAIPDQPLVSVVGDLNFCQGGSVQLSAPAAAGYVWSNGATTQNITVTNSGTFSVAVISAQGCTSIVSDAVVVNVTATPAQPTIAASGSTAICDGGSVTLTASAATGNYLWSNGATTQSITVSAAGNFTVQVVNGTCSSLVSAVTAVTTSPAPSVPTVTVTGSTTLCAGDSVVLTASVSEGYLWSNGATTRSITVRAAGTFTVQATTTAGCSSAASTATSVTLNTIPARPTITPSGSTSLCAGGTVVLNAPAGFTSYLWSNGATTQSITVNATGSFTVTVQNTGTCASLPSVAIPVTVSAAIPTPSITLAGSNIFCAGQDSAVLTAPAGFATYIWSNGATTRSITVRSVSGNYNVRVGNGSCVSATSVPVSITVNSVPGKPTVNFAGTRRDSLVASVAATSYIWKINGVVQTQTRRGIRVTSNGYYSVIAVSGSGCRGIESDSFLITPVKPVLDITTQVYPNPFQNSLNLSMDNLKDNSVVVNIFDVVGKLVYTEVVPVTNGAVNQALNVGFLPAGSYQLQINTSAGTIQQKLIHNK